ncbi:hypothetical protein ACFYKX_09320 [Cytobacillus sp. FJAT-54145]|uniref:Uncharacterized protein n=1 Tax=Cytobacillus spartinae TaxID=3299023 RepID=A0ABW6K9C8_9BACI
MQIFWFILLGMIIAVGLVMGLAEYGLVILGGGAFGLLLYIAIKLSKK